MPDNTVFVAAAAALILGIAVGYLSRRFLAANSVKHAESYADRLMADARAKQKEIVLEGKDDALKVQRAAEDEAREKRTDLQRQERLLLDRSEGLDRKVESLERREVAFEDRQREVDAEKARLAELQQQQLVELERVSGLTASEARQSLIQLIVDEAQAEAHQQVRDIERRAKQRFGGGAGNGQGELPAGRGVGALHHDVALARVGRGAERQDRPGGVAAPGLRPGEPRPRRWQGHHHG